jgi:hypothetical protein
MRREVKYIHKKIDAIYTAYYFNPDMDLVEIFTSINQHVKPLQDFLAKSRGYKDWTEFRAVACARQQNSMAFDRGYDYDD